MRRNNHKRQKLLAAAFWIARRVSYGLGRDLNATARFRREKGKRWIFRRINFKAEVAHERKKSRSETDAGTTNS